jgi:cytochrome c-type biogenesis protein CcmH
MMRKLFGALFFVWLAVAGCGAAFAVQPDEVLSDPALEHRARELSRELRCLVCQNQSIDDSEAALARDLRLLLRERLKAGDTDQQVLDYLVSRYGAFVLLKPPFNTHTLVLWLGPAGVLLIGGIALLVMGWRRRGKPLTGEAAAALSPAEQEKLAVLMTEPGQDTVSNP